MPVLSMTKGKCYYCNKVFEKSDMEKHLKECEKRKGVLKNKKGEKYFHILVEAYEVFWIHIEVSASATLKDLDLFLREIWLECCGHASEFNIKNKIYTSGNSMAPDMMWAGLFGAITGRKKGKSMDIKLSEALKPGVEFSHTYDFGTPTELELKVLSEYERRKTKKVVHLMARNEMPDAVCECGKKAVKVCCECIFDGEGFLCKKCAKKHECGEEMLLPMLNSPRTGMCGYTG